MDVFVDIFASLWVLQVGGEARTERGIEIAACALAVLALVFATDSTLVGPLLCFPQLTLSLLFDNLFLFGLDL